MLACKPRSSLYRLSGLLLMLASGLALADFKQDYARGQEAAADEKWSDVERYMQEAMAGSTTPAVRIRLYGQRFAPYVPQYYLGLAAYRSNDCKSALRWFKDPAAAPVIAQVSDFKGLADEAVKTCQQQLAVNEPSKPATQPSQPTTASGAEPSKPLAGEPSRPVSGQPNTGQPNTGQVNAGQPKQPPVQPPPSKPPTPVQTATTGAPALLTQTLSDYLSGRFSAASRVNPNGLSGKAKAHVLLIRSASLFALSELGGSQAAAQKAQAAQDAVAAKQSAPGLQADTQFFSPRFRAFFASAR